MNDEQSAAQAIKRFLQTVKGLADLAPGLESLGSVRQAEDEAKARLAAANAEVDAANGRAYEAKLKGETEAKKQFEIAAAELHKFEVKIKAAEEKLAGLVAETASVQTRYNEAKVMLDDIVKRVRG